VRTGHVPGGTVPYGYRRERKTLVPNDLEVSVVCTILESGSWGRPITDIVMLLNAQGLTRRNGKPWTERQVRAILSRRELYEHGKLHYGKVEGANEHCIILSNGQVS